MHYGVQPKPVRYNGKCKRCSAKASVVLVELRPSTAVSRQQVDVAIDELGRRFDFCDGYCIKIPHECAGGTRLLKLEAVRGVYNPGKECNTKCLAAIGHDCECRCGGKNHGSSFTVA
jgi:hypothetical protein